MTIKRALATCAAVFALSLLSLSARAQPSQQGQDSVAEAARKARARRKNPAKPSKVVTNDDLAPAPFTPNSATAQTDSKGAAATAQTQTTAAGGAGNNQASESDETRWRKRFAAAYKNLHQAEAELDVLQREWGKLQTQYYPDPQKALKEQNSRAEVNDHQQKIDAKKKEIEQLHQSITNLEEELRKAGGDRNWGRE